MKRDEFLKKIVSGSGILIVAPAILIQSCEKEDDPIIDGNNNNGGSDITIDLDDPANAALKTTGGSVKLNDNSIIVINKGDNEFIALSTTCTHKGCTVGYNAAQHTLPCPCHGSVFNTDGRSSP